MAYRPAASNGLESVKHGTVKASIILGVVALTVAIHYGLILEPIFGHTGWVHAIHGRFCYIPIVIAASWFGIRGGLTTAGVVSLSVLPYIFFDMSHVADKSGELVELVFYFAIAILTGALIDREWTIRRKQQQTQLQLERAHKLSLIGQMAAGVAHEIKNPLASIKGAVEIIGDEKTPAELKQEFLTIALNEIKRTDGTIKEFLAFARPKESRMEKLEISASLAASARQIETQASAKQVSIRTAITDQIYINGDSEKIHQVLVNLLLNAIEASDENSEIKATLRTSDTIAEIVIGDSGQGIADDDLKRIFDPFYSTKASGTGLGLAIVKTIVENHNGTINISSRPGAGTQVSVSFPRLRE
ncbi:MAG: ATP-binding protein [candidate division Zixibacteria bacterium]